MKTQKLVTLSLLALALSASADIFVLKDGTRLEGTILSQTADSYLLEVQVTKSIKDERTVAKADVKEIESEKLDEKAFEPLSGLVPVPDLTSSEEYDRRIVAMNAFLKAYPSSEKAKEAQGILSTLKEEAVLVSAGGIKLNGKIIPADEYKADAFELDSRVAEMKIRQQAASSDWLGALRSFETFKEDYRSSLAYNDLLPLIQQVLQAYESRISELARTLANRKSQQESGLEQMSVSARANTEAALREEMKAFEIVYENEKKSRISWVTPHQMHKGSLDDTLRAITQERRGLSSSNNEVVDGGKLYREAWSALQSGELNESTKTAVDAVKKAHLPDRYFENLKEVAKAAGLELQ